MNIFKTVSRVVFLLILFLFSNQIMFSQALYFGDDDAFNISITEDTIGFTNYYGLNFYFDFNCDESIDFEIVGSSYYWEYLGIPAPRGERFHIIKGISSNLELINLEPTGYSISFSSSDTIRLNDPTHNFEEDDAWGLLDFNVTQGPVWSNPNYDINTNPHRVKDDYIPFRILHDGEYVYGWFKYSIKVFNSYLVIEEIAIEKPYCMDLLKALPQSYVFDPSDDIPFILFPNPATNGNLSIVIPLVCPTEYTIEIFNIFGDMIIRRSFSGAKGENTHNFDTTDLENGLYLVRVILPDGSFSTRQIQVY